MLAVNKIFTDNSKYSVIKCKSRKEWLKARKEHIGGSDVSALIGVNKYRTNHDLWVDKHSDEIVEISNSAIQHGNDLEPVLRNWFKATHKNEYTVHYLKDVTLVDNENPFMAYSPDGLLTDKKTKKNGILEIKTATIQNSSMLDDWKEQIPEAYYCQVLHGLIVTGFDYVKLVAELRFAWKNDSVEIREYTIERKDIEDDINWLLNTEKRLYKLHYIDGVEPSVKIF